MLAVKNAVHLLGYTMSPKDPLSPLAQAEISFRIRSDIDLINYPVPVNGIMSRGELIIAVDETGEEDNELAGFITYKPRFPAFTSASIAYVVVDERYRGKGVMRRMLEELFKHYPAIGLDCDMALVPMYEKFGFYSIGVQGCHVAMETAPLNGKMIYFDQDDVNQSPEMKAAEQSVMLHLRDAGAQAYARRDNNIAAAQRKAAEFIANRPR
jgi:GNAT superfamily N-acetyltransferase